METYTDKAVGRNGDNLERAPFTLASDVESVKESTT